VIVATRIVAELIGATCHVWEPAAAGPIGAASDRAVVVPCTCVPGAVVTTILAVGAFDARSSRVDKRPSSVQVPVSVPRFAIETIGVLVAPMVVPDVYA
jgi:hypothetical protein